MMGYSWGIMGACKDAEAFARAIKETNAARLDVWFAAEQPPGEQKKPSYLSEASEQCQSFEDFILDETTALVYVSERSSATAEQLEALLSCGKGVVYAPALTAGFTDLGRLCEAAAEKGKLLLECLPMTMLPPLQRIHAVSTEDTIGELLMVQIDCGIRMPFDPEASFYRQSTGGIFNQHGRLPLAVATLLLGMPDQVAGSIERLAGGVDEQYVLTLRYKNGTAHALLMASATMSSGCEAHIIGSKSRIQLEAPFYGQTRVSLYNGMRRSGLMQFRYNHSEEVHVVEEAQRCLTAGAYESPHWTHTNSQQLATCIARCRKVLTTYEETL